MAETVKQIFKTGHSAAEMAFLHHQLSLLQTTRWPILSFLTTLLDSFDSCWPNHSFVCRQISVFTSFDSLLLELSAFCLDQIKQEFNDIHSQHADPKLWRR